MGPLGRVMFFRVQGSSFRALDIQVEGSGSQKLPEVVLSKITILSVLAVL